MDVVTEMLDTLVIAVLFGLAWLVVRASGSLMRRLLAWHDGRHPEADLEPVPRPAIHAGF